MSKDINDIINGRSSTEVRRMMTTRRTLLNKRREAEKDEKDLPPIQKASGLISERLPLPPEIIEGLLHRGSTMVYGGGSKTNKTFGLIDMAVSVATGKKWWDLQTTQGKVLYLDFELQKGFFRDRLDKIANAKALQPDDLENLDVWNLRGYATNITALAPRIIERIKNTPYRLIIVDPIYKVLGDRDENSAGDVNSLMNELDGIAVESDAAMVVGHHFSKGNKSKTDSKDRISGSGVFARSPDAIVTITPHEKEDVYTVETTLRNHKAMEPFCVRWSYPLMVRCEDEDPAKLKRPGAMQEKFNLKQLLIALGDEALTTTEWQKTAMSFYGMSESSFNSKKRALVLQPGQVVHQDDGKWKSVTPLGFEEKAMRERLKTQVQGAEGAIAPPAA